MVGDSFNRIRHRRNSIFRPNVLTEAPDIRPPAHFRDKWNRDQ